MTTPQRLRLAIGKFLEISITDNHSTRRIIVSMIHVPAHCLSTAVIVVLSRGKWALIMNHHDREAKGNTLFVPVFLVGVIKSPDCL